jgi:hypothetical protein
MVPSVSTRRPSQTVASRAARGTKRAAGRPTPAAVVSGPLLAAPSPHDRQPSTVMTAATARLRLAARRGWCCVLFLMRPRSPPDATRPASGCDELVKPPTAGVQIRTDMCGYCALTRTRAHGRDGVGALFGAITGRGERPRGRSMHDCKSRTCRGGAAGNAMNTRPDPGWHGPKMKSDECGEGQCCGRSRAGSRAVYRATRGQP